MNGAIGIITETSLAGGEYFDKTWMIPCMESELGLFLRSRPPML